MSRYYVHAFGWWFCMVNGWVRSPEGVSPRCKAAVEIVKDVQPGVNLYEVSA